MNTLELVKQDQVLVAMILKLSENNIEILNYDGHEICVKSGCLPVRISYEMCSCHGGRMWFNQDETNIHIELSSDEYNEELGIIDPETELAYYIDNTMISTIDRFKKFIYQVITVGKYGDANRQEIRYFDSVEDASYAIFDERGHDVLSEYGEVLHIYPNTCRGLRVKFDHEEKSKLYFTAESLKRESEQDEFEIDYTYSIQFMIFRKK